MKLVFFLHRINQKWKIFINDTAQSNKLFNTGFFSEWGVPYPYVMVRRLLTGTVCECLGHF